MNKNNIIGFFAYLVITLIFGGACALVCLVVKESDDRCHYYDGKWNRGDLIRGCVAIAIGMVINYLI